MLSVNSVQPCISSQPLVGSWTSATVGAFTSWKLANTTNQVWGVLLSGESVANHLPAYHLVQRCSHMSGCWGFWVLLNVPWNTRNKLLPFLYCFPTPPPFTFLYIFCRSGTLCNIDENKRKYFTISSFLKCQTFCSE